MLPPAQYVQIEHVKNMSQFKLPASFEHTNSVLDIL